MEDSGNDSGDGEDGDSEDESENEESESMESENEMEVGDEQPEAPKTSVNVNSSIYNVFINDVKAFEKIQKQANINFVIHVGTSFSNLFHGYPGQPLPDGRWQERSSRSSKFFGCAKTIDGKWNRYRPIAFTISPRLHHCKPEYTVAIATPNPQPWVGDAINFSRVSEIIPVYERWPKVLLLTVPLFGVS